MSLIPGVGAGKSCGRCPALKAQVLRLKAENKRLKAYILNLEAKIAKAKRMATEEEKAGMAGMRKANPPIAQGVYEGMKNTGAKLRKVL